MTRWEHRAGTIYFAQVTRGDLRPVKVGHTTLPIKQRLTTMRAMCPFNVELITSMPGYPVDEQWILKRFAPHLFSGREWFHPTQEVFAVIDEVSRTGRIAAKPDMPINVPGDWLQKAITELNMTNESFAAFMSVSPKRIVAWRSDNHLTSAIPNFFDACERKGIDPLPFFQPHEVGL